MHEPPLGSLTVTTLTLSPRGRWSVDQAGPVLRSALGLALRVTSCLRDCREPCEEVTRCAYGRLYEARGVRPMRLDALELDADLAPGERVQVHLVVPGDPGLRARTTVALRRAVSRGLGPEPRVRFRVLAEDEVEVDLVARAEALAGGAEVACLTPTAITLREPETDRDRRWDPSQTGGLRPILNSAGTRLRLLLGAGAPPEGSPWRFGDDPLVPETGFAEHCALSTWSQRQRRRYPTGGLIGHWVVRPTLAQAYWLAVAEVLGVGRGTTRGQGVVRCAPYPSTDGGVR